MNKMLPAVQFLSRCKNSGEANKAFRILGSERSWKFMKRALISPPYSD